ncbi:MAG: hypothetical protein R6X20_12900 [Phycisphaerae bacterium]
MLAAAVDPEAGPPPWFNPHEAIREFVETCEALPYGWRVAAAILSVLAGVAFLVWGFRLYRWLVVLIFVAIGIAAGVETAMYFGFNQSIGIIAGAVLLGVLAWPAHRLGWGLVGGVVFALVLAGLAGFMGIEGRVELLLIGVVAFVAGAAVTLLLMKPLIIVITALVGAALLTQGTIALTLLWPSVGATVVRAMDTRPYIPMVAALVLAAVGSAMQVLDTNAEKKKKKKKPSGGDD